MWNILWNGFAILGIGCTLAIVMVLVMILATEWRERKQSRIPDPRDNSCVKSYFNGKDEQT